MATIEASTVIDGVVMVSPTSHGDGRGRFVET
jgi:dTDP-4-dehydrorhamnose 3,5-epimerase-like enzyme